MRKSDTQLMLKLSVFANRHLFLRSQRLCHEEIYTSWNPLLPNICDIDQWPRAFFQSLFDALGSETMPTVSFLSHRSCIGIDLAVFVATVSFVEKRNHFNSFFSLRKI